LLALDAWLPVKITHFPLKSAKANLGMTTQLWTLAVGSSCWFCR